MIPNARLRFPFHVRPIHRRQQLTFEALESRLLLSVDLVADLNADYASHAIHDLSRVGDQLLFLTEESHRLDVWRHRGTATAFVTDFNGTDVTPIASRVLSAHVIASFDDQFYFRATRLIPCYKYCNYNYFIYSSDGTVRMTMRLCG